MNKKIFAIIMVIALILSSFTLAFANNSDENKEKKDNTGNRKIHVHLESDREDIDEVWVVFKDNDGSDRVELLKANGNSGNYTISKGGDLVSNTLTEIIVKTSDGEKTTFTYDAKESQQGQEGQGSINYRITVTESDEDGVIEDEIDDSDNNSDNNSDNDSDNDSDNNSDNDSDNNSDNDSDNDSDNNSDNDSDNNSDNDSDNNSDNNSDNDSDNDSEDDSDNNSDNNSDETLVVEDIADVSTPNNTTPDSTESTVNSDNSIQIMPEETPQGTPELEPQKISSTEVTPVETEIKTETLDLEDEETPLDIPSTGVATPFLYGAGALISLVGLLKRR